MSKIDIAISERLKDCRKHKDIFLSEAAEQIGITKQTLIDYEAGRGNPSLTTIQSICKVYGISPNYLISGNDDNVTKIDSLLKRKVYSLMSLLIDGDLTFNQLNYSLSFRNTALRSAISRCHAIWANTQNISKLEAIEIILKHLESLDDNR